MMNTKSRNHFLFAVLIFGIWACGINISYANSDLFPPQQNAPALTSYVSGGAFKHTYYISPTGNDSTGNGSINNPWLSFNGATSGGSGTPVAAGDLIYMRGGTYPTHTYTAWKQAYYALKRSGTATDYIVFTNYPGEMPIFTGANGSPSFSIHSNYVVINGLTFTNGGTFYFQNATNGVVQNSTFAACGDPWGDQIHGSCIGLNDNVNHIVIRNNYFGPSSVSHAIKSYTSNSITSNVKILYNRFNGIVPSYGVIANKGVMQNWEIAYNRFQDCRQAIVYGTVYSYAIDTTAQIHHNVFDNVYQTIIDRLGGSTEDLRDMHVYDNVVFNATSTKPAFLMLRCDDSTCMNSGSQAMGEFYNNVIYDVADAINPQSTSNFVNYPDYWNYNAYQSSTIRDSAENQNNLGAVSWQGNAIVASTAIQITGNSGNRFYYVSDTSPLRGKGRNGDNIGGFTWGTDPIRPMPPTLQ